MKLLIVDGSIRDGRATENVAKWVEKTAKAQLGDIVIVTADLKELNLPFMTEGYPPMMNPNRQTEGAVKQWLDALAEADGYVFVTPEYNHGMPAGLKNAIDTIDRQVMQKPFAVVSHGGVGGARSAEQVKLVLNSNLGAVPVPMTVALVGWIGMQQLISEDSDIAEGALDGADKSLSGVLDDLKWYAGALKTAREA